MAILSGKCIFPAMNAVGPYLTLTEAAKYCGYQPRRFRDLVREYSIPRRGPAGNRFSQSDLDAFMHVPVTFLVPGQKIERAPRIVT
ncbi:helix-turn-helix domain-containing protein [Solidesulfovibrio sp.]|uniref:helix-turn-helix domain-containing protein n=1 Tax=Solidesulfovibrio sp. TaxID=2910990 RepID=UPI0038B5DBA0